MNRVYRTVWNHARQCMVVASETTRSRSKTSGSRKIIVEAVAAAVLALGAGQAMAADICVGAQTSTVTMTSGNSCTVGASDSIDVSSGGNAINVQTTTGAITVESGRSVVSGSTPFSDSQSPGDNNAINIGLGGNVVGGISNAGTLTAYNHDGIEIIDGTVTGNIVNNGAIHVAHDGIELDGTTAAGAYVSESVINSGQIISETWEGMAFGNKSTIGGGITNSGSIVVSADGTSGVSIYSSVDPSIAPVIVGNLANEGSITLNGNGGAGLGVYAGSIGGSVTNSGSISALGGSGIIVRDARVNRAVQNSGTIDATTGIVIRASQLGSFLNTEGGHIQGASSGLSISSSTITGAVTNRGTITAAGSSSSSAGIYLGSSTIVGGIVNSGLIDGGTNGASGIYIAGPSTVSINNASGGTIKGANAIQLGSYYSSGSTYTHTAANVTGSITNSGQVQGINGSGIRFVGSDMTGNIVNNSGATITGTDAGIKFEAGLSGSTSFPNRIGSVLTGSIINSGLIQGSAYGISVTTSSTVSSGVSNLAGGTIHGDGPSGIGIYVNDSTLGGITNSGTISGGRDGIQLNGGAFINSGLMNSGLISGTSDGIKITAGTVTGGVVNAAGGRISGGQIGVAVNFMGNVDVLDNSGTIQGANYSVYVDGMTGTLGAIDIRGAAAKFIGDVSAVNTDVAVKTGSVFGNTNAFDVGSFTVESGGLFNFGNGPTTSGGLSTSGVKVANGFTNDGIVSVAATVAPTITGDYLQNAGGIYRMGLTGTTAGTYGVLNVTGNATVAGGIDVVISGAPTIADGTTVAGVIRSGGMTAIPANIAVTDNNLFLNFTAADVANVTPGLDLDLIVASDPNALPNAVSPNNPGATGVAQALQTIYNGGVPAGFQPVFDALATMTPQELNSALIELTPSLQGAAAQAGINALHSMNKIIQSRIESVQGLNSGNDTADRYAWTRVFGNWGDQDDHRGVTGFESRTQGLALGMDKPINDRIRAGGLFTYANTDLQSNLGSSKINVDTYEIAGYGSYNIDPQTDINVQLDVGLNKADSTRRLGFLGTTAKGDFDSFNWHLSGGIGRLFQLSDKTNLTPSFRVDYTHVKTDGYTEKGAGALNLRVDGSNYEELLLTVDTKFSHKLTDDGLKLVANGSVGYDFINEQAQSSSTFTGGGPTFVTEGLDVSAWVYRGGLGLVKETGNGMEFSARYDAEGRTSGYLNQTASVKVRWAF